MSFGNRMKGAIAGVFFGLLLVPGSIALHAWNEYRTIHRTKGLAEAQRDVVSVSDVSQLMSEYDGKLVHLSGLAHTDEVLADEKFSIRENGIHLKRQVEMYQWDESSSRKNDRKTYSYSKGWHEGRINSENFHESGHVNPALPFKGHRQSAKQVTLGAYKLTSKLLKEMDNWQNIALNEAAILEAVGSDGQGHFVVSGNELYWGKAKPSPGSPEVGDVRMTFKVVKPADVSVMARLQGEKFSTYKTSNGEPIEDLYYGLMSSDELVGKLKTENTIMAWLIRGGGFLMCGIGISLIFGPAQALVSWIPMVGDITGFMIGIVAFLLASIISLTTISIAWIAVRPLLGITLLVLTAALIAALLFLRRSTKTEPPIADASMFVN